MREEFTCNCGVELKWTNRFPEETFDFEWLDKPVTGTRYFYECDNCGTSFDRKYCFRKKGESELEIDITVSNSESKRRFIKEPKALKGGGLLPKKREKQKGFDNPWTTNFSEDLPITVRGEDCNKMEADEVVFLFAIFLCFVVIIMEALI